MPVIASTKHSPATIELDAEDKRSIAEMDPSVFLKATFPQGVHLAEWKTDEENEEER